MVITSLLGGAWGGRQEAERCRAGRGVVTQAVLETEGRSPVTTSESLRARRLLEILTGFTSRTQAHLV